MANFFRKIPSALLGTIRQFPVEIGISFYVFVTFVLVINDVEPHYLENLALAPLFFGVAYILNNLLHIAGSCQREGSKGGHNPLQWVYYLCWLPIVPLWWVDVSPWVDSAAYGVSLALVFLGIFSSRGCRDNARFVSQGINYVLDVVLALVFASVAFGAISGIYSAMVVIFSWDWDAIPDFFRYATAFTYTLATPMIFLMLARDNIDHSYFPNRFLDVLLNYILTPALLLYNALLYVYFLKVVVTWQLPHGIISNLVFVFVIAGFVLGACQPLLEKRYFDWYYDRFSLISLPALLMFWIGISVRLSSYGLTEPRVYLVVCGAIMTIAILMFIRPGRGRYLAVSLTAMGALALFTYLPFMSAGRIGYCSQARILRTNGEQIGILDGQGNFLHHDQWPEVDTTCTVQYERVYSALSYLYREKKTDRDAYPEPWRFRQSYIADAAASNADIRHYNNTDTYNYDVSGFERLYSVNRYGAERPGGLYIRGERAQQSDTLKVFVYTDERLNVQIEDLEGQAQAETVDPDVVSEVIDISDSSNSEYKGKLIYAVSHRELLESMLRKIGRDLDNLPSDTAIYDYPEFFVYDGEGIRIIFESLTVDIDEPSAKPVIRGVFVEFILLK